MDNIGKRMKHENKKVGIMTKTWERCKSIGRGGVKTKYPSSSSVTPMTRRSKSWPNQRGNEIKIGKRVAPDGCFSVYVGSEMQRFVIKTEYANHPLFMMLLEEAELEYGYSCQGPLTLPCNVDVFIKVLVEIDNGTPPQGCTFGANRSRSAYQLLSPSRMIFSSNF